MHKFGTIFIGLLITCLLAVTVRAAEVTYYHTDAMGTPLAITDDKGKVVWKGDYLPFGEERTIVNNPDKNKRRFVGKEKDEESGLHYFGARYMDEKSGRFISPDPVKPVDPKTSKTNTALLTNPLRLNRYVYGLNNPYRYVDPDGNMPKENNGFNPYELEDTGARNVSGYYNQKYGDEASLAKALWGKITGKGSAAKNTPIPNPAPDFVVTPKGEAIPVPSGATGPTPTRAPGFQYTGGSGGHGLDTRTTGVRIMEGNANQGPRAVYMNQQGQTINPATGRTVPNSDSAAHHYLDP